MKLLINSLISRLISIIGMLGYKLVTSAHSMTLFVLVLKLDMACIKLFEDILVRWRKVRFTLRSR